MEPQEQIAIEQAAKVELLKNAQLREDQTLEQMMYRVGLTQELGSFSQRHPALGRMVRCPYCRQRKRENDPQPCCNPVYRQGTENTKTRQAGRKNPRLTRNNPPFFLIHQRLKEMEAQPDFVEVPFISGIVEAEILRGRKERARRKRNQQKRSRSLNRKR